MSLYRPDNPTQTISEFSVDWRLVNPTKEQLGTVLAIVIVVRVSRVNENFEGRKILS